MEKKTAEEILRKYCHISIAPNGDEVVFTSIELVATAIDRFAKQEVSAYQKELASLKEVVKELIPIAETMNAFFKYHTVEMPNEEMVQKVLDRAKKHLSI